MANIMQSLKVSNKPSRNAFDMSENLAFTSCLGAYLPVRHMHLNAGDKFSDTLRFFSRTTPVRSAAYGRIRETFDTFFVPYRLLWDGAEHCFSANPTSFRFADTVKDSSAGDSSVVPYSTPAEIGQIIKDLYTNTLKVQQSLTTGTTSEYVPSSDPCWSFYGPQRCEDMSRLVEYLGYGKVVTLQHNSNFENTSILWTDDVPGYRRENIPLNMLPLFAYHKIYYDFYRNTQWEDNQPHMYYFRTQSPGVDNDIELSAPTGNYINKPHLLDLHYCNYEKDKYLGVLPSSQLGQPSVIDTTSGLNNLLSVNYTASSSNSKFYNLGVNGTHDSTSTPSDYLSSEANIDKYFNFSVLALRQASAMQKFLEISQFSPQDYKHQVKAHFDFDIEIGRSNLVQYLDGCSSIVDINPVLNQSLEDGDNEPTIYGKGDNVGQYNIDFTAPEPGIVMTIYHASPIVDYDGSFNMIPECSKHFYTDFPIPEFDNIGLQSVTRDEIDIRKPDDDLQLIPVYGYAPRYIDFKSRVDRVLGDFSDDGTLKTWVLPLPLRVTLGYFDFKQIYVQHPSDYSDWYLDQHYCRFKVDPRAADNIFFLEHRLDNKYSTDQLLVDASFDTTKVSNLDRNGLPY